MKTKLQAILTIKDNKTLFLDAEGKEITIKKTLAKKFALTEGEQLMCLILADDGKAEPDFDINKAKQILARKQPISSDMKIVTRDNRNVKIYTAGAAGDYPIVGLDPDNMPCCWNEEGKAQNGNEQLDIFICPRNKEEN